MPIPRILARKVCRISRSYRHEIKFCGLALVWRLCVRYQWAAMRHLARSCRLIRYYAIACQIVRAIQ
jgi:hypothetical protein